MEPAILSSLQSSESLKNVPADQLQWLIDHGQVRSLAEGEYLFQAGEAPKATHFLLEGRIRVYLPQNQEIITVMEPGDITGYLPFSRVVKAVADGLALQDSRVLSLSREYIREMIAAHFELTQALVHIMTTRVRDFTSLQRQSEKMMALGKLSAGLAHELNNPAAAIVRGAISLKNHLKLIPDHFKEVIAIRMEPGEVDDVRDRLFDILGRTAGPRPGLIERTEKEDEIRDWLEERFVSNSAEIAENLLDFGFTCEDLEVFRGHIPAASLSPVFNWINSNLVTERMVQDILESSQRISDLVSSVKNFTHMDQRGKEWIDIHTGIRNTLTMMQHKFKKGSIDVIEEYAEGLPKIHAMAGELNQVWTNLIDNAIDAMETDRKGQLRIRTKKDREFIQVSVIDNGPGIPDDVKARIFDPFFTTKEIGKGTGMGLDLVNRIVRQHRGSIKVESRPGHTEFILCLPIREEQEAFNSRS